MDSSHGPGSVASPPPPPCRPTARRRRGAVRPTRSRVRTRDRDGRGAAAAADHTTTDTAGVLDAGQRADVQNALDTLYDEHKVSLWVVYTADFDGLSREAWTEQTAKLSGLGNKDALLAVATTGRDYWLDVPPRCRRSPTPRSSRSPRARCNGSARTGLGRCRDRRGGRAGGRDDRDQHVVEGTRASVSAWSSWPVPACTCTRARSEVTDWSRRSRRHGRSIHRRRRAVGAADPGARRAREGRTGGDGQRHPHQRGGTEPGRRRVRGGRDRAVHRRVRRAKATLASAFRDPSTPRRDIPETPSSSGRCWSNSSRPASARRELNAVSPNSMRCATCCSTPGPTRRPHPGRGGPHRPHPRGRGHARCTRRSVPGVGAGDRARTPGHGTRERITFAEQNIEAGRKAATLPAGKQGPAVVASRAAEGALDQARQLTTRAVESRDTTSGTPSRTLPQRWRRAGGHRRRRTARGKGRTGARGGEAAAEAAL
ncbi:hypothetical protein GS930_14455, partial [Rhodococcus hoagii]|nr:hypothetical protein [Prescottella equi]